MSSNAFWESPPEDFFSSTLGEVCDQAGGEVQTGPFGSQLHASDYVAQGVPCVMPQDLADHYIATDQVAFVSEADARRLGRHRLQDGDIICSRRGDVTRRALVTDRETGWLCGTGCLRIRPPQSVVRASFLFYYLGHPDIRSWIVAHAQGATMPNLNTSILRKLPIAVPVMSEQRFIAAILSTFDEKIELNRQVNRTLEEIAQTLFRAWFVDFEGETDFVESELGPIPRGWEAMSLGQIADNRRETVNPDNIDPEMPYVGLGDLVPQTITSYTWGRAGDASSTKVAFEKGDLLFGKLRPYFKKVIVAPFAGVCSSDMLVLRPREPQWFGYLLGLLTLDTFIDFCDGASTGTRMPRINWRTMSRYPIAVPKDRVRARQSADLARVLVERINHNIFESRTVAALRDTLLPKLISGEIRVPEAEELAREAV